jgi:hypothetical protein
MKTTIRRIIAFSFLVAASNIPVAARVSTEPPGGALRIDASAEAAPTVVTEKVALSPAELAKYQQKAEASQAAAADKTAGAVSNTTMIVIGVVVVVALIALAAGGGGGSY